MLFEGANVNINIKDRFVRKNCVLWRDFGRTSENVDQISRTPVVDNFHTYDLVLEICCTSYQL